MPMVINFIIRSWKEAGNSNFWVCHVVRYDEFNQNWLSKYWNQLRFTKICARAITLGTHWWKFVLENSHILVLAKVCKLNEYSKHRKFVKKFHEKIQNRQFRTTFSMQKFLLQKFVCAKLTEKEWNILEFSQCIIIILKTKAEVFAIFGRSGNNKTRKKSISLQFL